MKKQKPAHLLFSVILKIYRLFEVENSTILYSMEEHRMAEIGICNWTDKLFLHLDRNLWHRINCIKQMAYWVSVLFCLDEFIIHL